MMGMNEHMLRKAVREIIRESSNPKVAEKIAQYKENPRMWMMAQNDFENMARGEGDPDVMSQYYPGWKPADFQAVLDAMG